SSVSLSLSWRAPSVRGSQSANCQPQFAHAAEQLNESSNANTAPNVARRTRSLVGKFGARAVGTPGGTGSARAPIYSGSSPWSCLYRLVTFGRFDPGNR